MVLLQDVFGRSADGARFRIDVTGTNLPSMSPSTISLGSGSYQSAYSPVKAGTYTISIYVGNGGQEYQDLIAGDASASQANPNPYTLIVSPAVTSPFSCVAQGTFLTISTAGTSSSFIITARDEFLNRRPGGDSVSVLLTLWNVVSQAPLNPSASPNTGNVVDNADGSYGTTFRLTQSGSYMVSISFAGVSGAGSPFMLEIASAPAEIALTYVYGDLLNVVAGATSTLYVQTRDKYGNFLRVDPTAYPSGSEDIVFELCQTVGNDATLPCLGGNQDTNVGITISYAVGPSGSSTNPAAGLPYYGLYQIVYFPFNEGSFVPEVRLPCLLLDGDGCSGQAQLYLRPVLLRHLGAGTAANGSWTSSSKRVLRAGFQPLTTLAADQPTAAGCRSLRQTILEPADSVRAELQEAGRVWEHES